MRLTETMPNVPLCNSGAMGAAKAGARPTLVEISDSLELLEADLALLALGVLQTLLASSLTLAPISRYGTSLVSVLLAVKGWLVICESVWAHDTPTEWYLQHAGSRLTGIKTHVT